MNPFATTYARSPFAAPLRACGPSIDPPDWDEPAEVTDDHTEAAQAEFLADAGRAAETLLESVWIRDHALELLDASPSFRAEYLALYADDIKERAQEIAEAEVEQSRADAAEYAAECRRDDDGY